MIVESRPQVRAGQATLPVRFGSLSVVSDLPRGASFEQARLWLMGADSGSRVMCAYPGTVQVLRAIGIK